MTNIFILSIYLQLQTDCRLARNAHCFPPGSIPVLQATNPGGYGGLRAKLCKLLNKTNQQQLNP